MKSDSSIREWGQQSLFSAYLLLFILSQEATAVSNKNIWKNDWSFYLLPDNWDTAVLGQGYSINISPLSII